MNWTDLRGHHDRIDMLRRSFGRGRMAHAWLFAGPAGVGKALFARIFAQCLLCESHTDQELLACGSCSGCRQMDAGTHPDFFHVRCPEGKSEIPVEVFLGPPEKRGRAGLIYDLSLRPMAGRRRIAIIDDANRLNDEGANCMLKTIEEPPPDALLILIADNLDAVLPTIRSRCQLIRFSPLNRSDLGELLTSTGLAKDPAEAASVAAISDGSLQTAAQLLNPGLRTLRHRLHEFLSAADINPLEAAKVLGAGLEELGSETSEQRRNLVWLIRFAAEFYRQIVLALSGRAVDTEPGSPVLVATKRVGSKGLHGLELATLLFDRCLLAESQIDWNISPARVLEALFDDLARTSRRGY